MALYKVCGLTIESTIPFPELAPADSKEPDYSFDALLESGVAPSCHWSHHYYLSNGKPWLSLAGRDTDYHLQFPDLARFHVTTDPRTIRCYREPGVPLDSIMHLFLDVVIPLVLSQQGKLALHASAVLISGKIVAFLGETRRGKSTIAASFGQQGFPVVTDDCLVVEEKGGQFFGIPYYPGLRLWPDTVSALFGYDPLLPQVAHYTDKKLLWAAKSSLPFCTTTNPLRRIYVLAANQEHGDTRDITIEPLSPRDAFMELVKYPYRLRISDRERLRDEFEALCRVVSSLTFRRMVFPQIFSLLPKIQETILTDLRDEGCFPKYSSQEKSGLDGCRNA
ncbi:MAG: hypothetical protein JRI47_00760 [Deltaproteobacteria bacterium]|nr:hypothetical protein [Deltaproteobacteria bacterium]